MVSVCCEDLINQKNIISPFKRIIVFDWYDGIVSCVLQCSFCNKNYLCQLIAWDLDFEIRIFLCVETTSDSWKDLISRISQLEKPSWPVWIPSVCGSKSEIAAIIDDFILEKEKTVSSNELSSFIVASRDLNEWILSAIKNEGILDNHFTLSDVEEITNKPIEYHREWFEKLGIK